jgi:glycosyltransferase involved in cell wall biosynthesis
MIVPGLDVIIPVQDVDQYLEAAIASILDQSVDVSHIWVVDAGSEKPVALPSSRAVHQHCSLIRSEARLYCGAARNLGVSHSHRNVIGFLDADDLWPLDRNRLLVDALESSGADWAYGTCENFAEASAFEILRVPEGQVPARLAGGGLFRRAAFDRVGGFNGSLGTGEFVDFLSRFRSVGLTETSLPEVTLRRRIHPESTTTHRADLRSEYLTVVRQHLQRSARGE